MGEHEDSRYKLHFFELTTGDPHPHSSIPAVEISSTYPSLYGFSQAEVVGDHILTVLGSPRRSSLLSLVSWKTGVVTHVSDIVYAFHLYPPALVDFISFAITWIAVTSRIRTCDRSTS